MNINYGQILDKKIEEIKLNSTKPSLLLHACCAPCSSAVVEYLNEYFNITLYFYNPNISESEEYRKRVNTQREKALFDGTQDNVVHVCRRTMPLRQEHWGARQGSPQP